MSQSLRILILSTSLFMIQCSSIDNPLSNKPTEKEIKDCEENSLVFMIASYSLCVDQAKPGVDCTGQAFFTGGAGLQYSQCRSGSSSF